MNHPAPDFATQATPARPLKLWDISPGPDPVFPGDTGYMLEGDCKLIVLALKRVRADASPVSAVLGELP